MYIPTYVMYRIVYIQFVEENLGVMSVGFLLSSPNDAVIWRGPKKNGINACLSLLKTPNSPPPSLHQVLLSSS